MTNTYSQSRVLLADLQDYVSYGRPLSGFLEAVVSNDLKAVIHIGDEHSIALLPMLIEFMENSAPYQSWGRKGAYFNWAVLDLDG